MSGSKVEKHHDDKKAKSRATSCERCKRRKQKCDHRLPTCTNCLKANVQCVQPEKYVLHVPEKDDYTVLLEKKVAKLEEELHRTGSVNSSPHIPHVSSPLSVGSASTPPVSTVPNGTAEMTQSTQPRVSILNTDTNETAPPKSFSVVSTLLKDTFWGRDKKAADSSTSPNVSDSGGLLPDYNFDAFLKCRPAEVPDSKTGELLINYYVNIQSQGKFTFLEKNMMRQLHSDRFNQPKNLDDPTYRFNSFLLFGVYAMAAVLNPVGDTLDNKGAKNGAVDPNRLYATALCHARLCRSRDPIWQIQALMICAAFQMRTDVDKGCHFDMVNRSMKMCQEMGLHQCAGFENLTLYEQEMRIRLFWSVYGLERLYAVSTGRPFVIDERDITLPYPVDLDDDDLTHGKIQAARDRRVRSPSQTTATTTTPLTFVIYLWQLRRLESDMVMNVYRADKSMEELFAKVDYYLTALRDWRDNHSLLTTREQNIAAIAYSKAVRLLLQPFLPSLDPNGPLFKKCVLETGRICSVFREFYRKTEQGFTTIAMHTNFIAGLTLIYCLWLSKDGDYLPILEHIRVCTSSLYLLTERSQLCREYRDKFEDLVSATIRHVTDCTRGIVTAPVAPQQPVPATAATEPVSTAAPAPVQGSTRPSRPPMVSANSATSIFQNIAQPLEEVKSEPVLNSIPASTSSVAAPQPPVNPTTAAAAPVMHPSYNGNTAQQASNASKGWLDAYGYDDTMFNMIQDISSWTKETNDQINSTDTSQQIAEHMWMNFTDFSLT